MRPASLRALESEALAALRRLGLQDGSTEAEFDALARAAARVCETPIALVNLVDADRQWFKARVGLPGATQMPRADGFCAHTVLGTGPLEVPDARADPRFADKPLVAGAHAIRFYAGVPLRLTGGAQIGTLCVLDRQPRVLSALQREVLADLALAVSHAMEARQALRDLATAEELRGRRLYESTPAMLQSMDREGRLIAVSDQWLAKLGYLRSEVIGRPAPELLAPASRLRAAQVMTELFALGQITDVPCQMVARDGRVLDVLLSATIDTGADGQPVSLSVVQDVTEQRGAERALDQTRHDLQKILDAVPSQIGYWGLDLRNQIANQAHQTWYGITPDQLRGRHISALLGDNLFEHNRPRLAAALAGLPQHFYTQVTRSPEGTAARHAQVSYLPDTVDGQVRGIYRLVHDITEGVETRRELAAAQRESEALLRTLHQHAIVSVADERGRIIEVNDNFCAISGYSRDELLGQDQCVLNADLHGQAFWLSMWQTISRGQAWRGEVCNQAKDGSLYWLNSLVAPVLGADGQIEKYIAIRNDITPIKLAQEQAERASRDAEAAERFLREVTDRLPLRIAYVDAQLRFRFVNEAHCQHLGLPRAQIVGHTLDALQGEALPAQERAHVYAALGGNSIRYDVAEGERTVEYQLVPDRSAGGAVAGFFALGTDITERKRTDIELRRTLTLLRAVLDASTQVSIIAVEPAGTVSIFNRGAEQLLGYTAAEVVGKTSALKFHDEAELRQRARALAQQLGRPVHSGQVLVEPEVLNQALGWQYVHRSGRRIPMSLAMTPMRDDEGALVGYLGVAHDISARLQYEVSLRDALHRAQSANQAKSRFLANMSHEIRTPMNAVIGLAYLLQHTPLNPEQADTLDKLKRAGQSLLALINDVLDLSKIEASEMAIEQAPFHLATVLDDLAALARLQADGKGVGFALHAAAGLPQALVGDATRLRQVLTNLITNAVKFTERGEVQLTVTPLAATGGPVRLRFEVRDSGVGIPAQALSKLFAPFVQADTSTTRRFGGTGLGLSIVKQLVTLMGGEVGVHSTPGVGSVFWVELGFAACEHAEAALLAPAAASPASPGLAGVRVLVTDDNPINLEVARRILALEGASVWLAANGQEAVDHLLANPQGVDVVLMDVQMPVLDGHDATRRIRSGLGLKRLPIIALTAGITTGDHARARAAGMNGVVAKPFDPPALVRCIRRHVPLDAAMAPPCAGGPPTPTPTPALPLPLPPAAPWPTIDGIDAQDACARLGGDTALLQMMLRQLLDRFSNLAEPTPDAAVAILTARLHDLKGSAGTLGAKAIATLAAQAERAAKARDTKALPALLRQLAAALAALRTAAAPLLQSQPADNPAPGPAKPLDAGAVHILMAQLRQGDIAALGGFKALSPQLRLLLGPQRHGQLRAQIDQLQFAEAASLLAAMPQAATEQPAVQPPADTGRRTRPGTEARPEPA